MELQIRGFPEHSIRKQAHMAKTPRKNRRSRWSDLLARRDELFPGRPTFALKGTAPYLDCYDGYLGGHELLDFLIARTETAVFQKTDNSSDSPFNVASHETLYRFEDGGLLIYSGNYDSDEKPVGAYVIGFKALRWAVDQLSIKQPARLKGELL